MDIEPVMLDEQTTKLGAVETWEHAKKCGELFAANRAHIDGVLVCLPNFGDERGVADVLKLSGLNVPILVQAYPDDLDQFSVERRRDAYLRENQLQKLMRYICKNGFEHHAAMNASRALHLLPKHSERT